MKKQIETLKKFGCALSVWNTTHSLDDSIILDEIEQQLVKEFGFDWEQIEAMEIAFLPSK